MKVPTYVTQAVLAYFTQRARTIARKRIDSLSLGHSRRRSLRSRCSRRRRLCGADLKLLPISQSWNKGPSLSVSFYAVLCSFLSIYLLGKAGQIIFIVFWLFSANPFKRLFTISLVSLSRHHQFSVTRWLDCFFNIWPFATIKICPIAQIVGPIKFKIL